MGDTRSTLDTSRTSFYEYRPLPASHVEEGSSSSLSNAEGVAPTSSTTVNMDSATEPSIENNSNEVGWAFSQLHRPGRLERLDTYVRGSSYLIARIPNDEVNQTTPTFRNGRCMVEYQPYPPSVSHRLFSDALETTKQSVNEIRAVDLRALDGALDTRPVDSSESNGTSPTSRYKPGGVLTMILEDLGDETKNNLNTKGKGKAKSQSSATGEGDQKNSQHTSNTISQRWNGFLQRRIDAQVAKLTARERYIGVEHIVIAPVTIAAILAIPSRNPRKTAETIILRGIEASRSERTDCDNTSEPVKKSRGRNERVIIPHHFGMPGTNFSQQYSDKDYPTKRQRALADAARRADQHGRPACRPPPRKSTHAPDTSTYRRMSRRYVIQPSHHVQRNTMPNETCACSGRECNCPDSSPCGCSNGWYPLTPAVSESDTRRRHDSAVAPPLPTATAPSPGASATAAQNTSANSPSSSREPLVNPDNSAPNPSSASPVARSRTHDIHTAHRLSRRR